MAKRNGRMIERVLEVASHRNGIGGAPFFAVRFTHIDDAGVRRQMLATVFAEIIETEGPPSHEDVRANGRVAVVATDRLETDGVEFGVNSWRGDQFEPELLAAIRVTL